MIDFFTLKDEQMNIGQRLLRDAIKIKKWKVEIPYIGSPHCFIERSDGVKMHIFATAPDRSSFAAGHLANDKFATYQLLSKQAISQPETILISEKTWSSDLENANKLIKKYGSVVVKPIDGGHGDGITVDIKTDKQLLSAIKYAQSFSNSKHKLVIVQQMLNGKMFDLRLAVVGGKFVAAINRLPVMVTGDGKRNILELINYENETFRGEPYYTKLAFININSAKDYLGNSIFTVPKKGEKVPVLGVANYGQGGELVDITDDVPAWLVEEAEKIAETMELPVCGIDYLSARLPKKALSREDLSAFFIEANKCPSLAIHDRPTVGVNREVVKKYVDYLDEIAKAK